MPILIPKRCVNAFGKMSIFRLFDLLFFIGQKGVFSFQNISKDIFLACIDRKITVGKKAIFGPKPWVIPLGKMSFFRVFELLVFIAQKGVFSFQNIVKEIFLAYIASKKNLEKWQFLDENHGLTPLEKCKFFDFLNFVFLKPREAFFLPRISYKNIFLAYFSLKKKVRKMPILIPKRWVNPFGKM